VGETGERVPLADVRLRAPIVPKKFFHTAGNFSDHHEELQAVDWSHPVHKGIVFFQNVDAIIGPDDAIVYPEGLTKELDYELELAIIIGRSGKFFGPDEAENYIAGYMIFNDITARDIQRREMQSGVFSFSKAIDTFCPIGPWIVTKDEVPDAQALAMELRVNGQVRPARQHRQDAHLDPPPRRAPLGAGLLGRRHPHHRHDIRRGRGATEPVRLLPPAPGTTSSQGLIKDGHTCEVFERDADDSRKIGYYLHMNADGGEALRRCLPDDLFELYAETSRRTYDRRESIVLDDQLSELSSQPHLGPRTKGRGRIPGVHRRTLRSILRARLGDSFRPGQAVTGYKETPDGVSVTLADGSTAQGDVLVGADGIRSAVRRQRLPGTTIIDAGVRGLGVFGRTPLTPGLLEQLPPNLFDGVIIAPDVTLEPVEDYVMISCSVAPGTRIPPAAEWTAETPAMLRDAMLSAIEGWHPAAQALVAGVDLDSVFVIPFGSLELAPPWEPSRVTMIGDAAHAMLPTLGMGANLALRDAAHLLDQLFAAVRGEVDLVTAIGIHEQQMRDYVYPFMRMTMEHDRQFGGGALEDREQHDDASAS
jgi:2-polyprenyl-6-methoxyphenol hydroxylase-like FAD-dependent oxidoreductase